jgi:hypothetical protein
LLRGTVDVEIPAFGTVVAAGCTGDVETPFFDEFDDVAINVVAVGGDAGGY